MTYRLFPRCWDRRQKRKEAGRTDCARLVTVRTKHIVRRRKTVIHFFLSLKTGRRDQGRNQGERFLSPAVAGEETIQFAREPTITRGWAGLRWRERWATARLRPTMCYGDASLPLVIAPAEKRGISVIGISASPASLSKSDAFGVSNVLYSTLLL